MEVLLLGPLEVRSSGERLPLGGPRQRALLADLALHAGSVVSMDTLLDDLWHGEPPATAEAVVQNAVHRLRRSLGREAIETRSPGYVLRIDPGAIDAKRFERLVRDAAPLPPAERSAALARRAGALARDAVRRPRLRAVPAGRDRAPRRGAADGARGPARGRGRARPSRRGDRRRDVAPFPPHRPRARLSAHHAGAAPGGTSAGCARRVRGHQARARRAVGPRALARDACPADDDPDAGSRDRTQPAREAGGGRGAPAGLAPPRRAAARRRPRAGAGGSRARGRAHGGRRRRGPSRRPRLARVGRGARGRLRRRRRPRGRRRPCGARGGRAARDPPRPGRPRRGTPSARVACSSGTPIPSWSARCSAGRGVRCTTPRRTTSSSLRSPLVSAATRSTWTWTGDCSPSGRRARSRRRPPRLSSTAPTSSPPCTPPSTPSRPTARPRHAVVVGEAGIGKSRLVEAFADEVPAAVLRAACVSYGEGISFLPLLDLWDAAAEVDDGVPPLGELASADAAFAAARAAHRALHAVGPSRRRPRRHALGGPDVPRPGRVRRPHGRRAAARRLDDPSRAPRAAAIVARGRDRPDAVDGRGRAASRRRAARARRGRRRAGTHDPRRCRGRPALPRAARGPCGALGLVGRRPRAVDARRPPREPHRRARARRARRALPGRGRRSRVLRRGNACDHAGAGAPGAGRPSRVARPAPARAAERRRARVRAPARPPAAYLAIGRPDRAAMHERLARWLAGEGAADEVVGAHLERAAADSTPESDRDGWSREAADAAG